MSNLIIETKFTVTWNRPVYVRIGNGAVEAVRGPEDGLHYLYHRWPYMHDDLCELAQCDCLKAIQKELPCDRALDAFINAATRAGMLA